MTDKIETLVDNDEIMVRLTHEKSPPPSVGHPDYVWEFDFLRKRGELLVDDVLEAYLWADHYSVAKNYSNGVLKSKRVDKESVIVHPQTGSHSSLRRFSPIPGSSIELTINRSAESGMLIATPLDQGIFFGRGKGLLLRGFWEITATQFSPESVKLKEVWGTAERKMVEGLAAFITPHGKIIRKIIRNMANQMRLDWKLPKKNRKLNARAMQQRIELREKKQNVGLDYSDNRDYWGSAIELVRTALIVS